TSETISVGGVGAIPAVVGGSPTAAVLNLTEATATTRSYLSVTPSPLIPPATTSDANFAAGEVRANADLATLSSSGSVSVYNLAGNTDFAIDAFGYFAVAAGIHPPL
ncbi:MAG TPA: hypothetical protein VG184_13935, partial [Acidimicrobiales bacterium]|nr:hypothetical protein [Acidimicrobiales bacterium]